ncbi:Clp protease N-terminal domain-containing protein [Tomitella cavernea]|uniref:Clp protease N-terminal domain-containing protein n=1 Tax=Tomitella cavernea TaxID=1387982 RepID=A0ABP9CBD3_9ACTN|nr:Clp protease N-terminal domain-containing protein [Tomitella cavernea]
MNTARTPITGTVRLDDLIAAIAQSHTDPLEQLIDAVLAADHLSEVADHLIGHFVDQARRSGASWTEIGASMGVTKQAAQKRFVAKPAAGLDAGAGFSKFTPRARNVVVAAQNEARAGSHDRITPAHLTLGLLTEPGSLALHALAEQGVTPEKIREAATRALPPASDEVPALIPYDDDAKTALEHTFATAQRMGHDYVGTEHLLLALLEHQPDGPLGTLGVDRAAVQQYVAETLQRIVAQREDGGDGRDGDDA